MRTLPLAFLGFLTLSAPALAHGGFVNAWEGIYPNSVTVANVENGAGTACQLCHVESYGGSPWNAYGWSIRENMLAGDPIQDAILNAASSDSDHDPVGAANAIEIGAGTQPGWRPGPNNIQYFDGGQTPGSMPPATILGSLDPSSALLAYCSPGSAGVSACPCANPPGAPGLGCNNSEDTGGASIGASGVPSLAADSIVFTTAGQTALGTSILMQGTAQAAAGLVFGQGVRCVDGALLRLYVKPASAGSISVPALGDPPVSAVSASLGDPLAPGAQREYMVYYRDPVVLGGCPSTSTFNGTAAGSLLWLP